MLTPHTSNEDISLPFFCIIIRAAIKLSFGIGVSMLHFWCSIEIPKVQNRSTFGATIIYACYIEDLASVVVKIGLCIKSCRHFLCFLFKNIGLSKKKSYFCIHKKKKNGKEKIKRKTAETDVPVAGAVYKGENAFGRDRRLLC